MIRIQNDVQFENPINLLAWCCQHVTIVSYICCRNNCDGKFAECKTLKNLGLDEYDLIFISWIQVYVICKYEYRVKRDRFFWNSRSFIMLTRKFRSGRITFNLLNFLLHKIREGAGISKCFWSFSDLNLYLDTCV